MKLRVKLMLAPALTGAMLVLTLGGSLWALDSHKTRNKASQAATHAAQTAVSGVQGRLAQLQSQLYRTITIIGSMDDKAVKAARARQTAMLTAIAADAAKQEGSADAAMQKSLKTLAAQVKKYQQSADNAIDLSTVDPNTGVASLQTSDADFAAIGKTLGEMNDMVTAASAAETARENAASQRAEWGVVAFGLLAGTCSIAFAWVTQRRIVAEIKGGAEAAAQVARGHLDKRPHSDAKDEVGDLLRALGSMVGQLRESMHTMQQAADTVGTASAEIATGNLDLSARTEQTASNLQQAAASMEELTATVKQSADSAQQANRLAASAAEVAERGGKVVAQVVITMDDINASSKKISDIIGVIDGIAFQTNILALNAAVEAARAGEQGRGFAVVAAEVRNLAQRSAQAAKEIKALIGASVDKVEGGARLVADAGVTMKEIVSSVQRVSAIIGEISTASSEQSDGIGQINTAVTQLDQMTQQNAALVEQSTAAAESLKDQAATLRETVGRFQL